MSLPFATCTLDMTEIRNFSRPSEDYSAEQNASLKEFWPDNKKEHDEWIVPYIGLTTSQKLLIMNDKYLLPTVVAYVAKTKW